VRIADSMLSQIRDQLDAQGIKLVVTAEAAAWICAQKRDATLGARPLRRTLERAVKNPLASMLVRSEIKSGDRIVIGEKADALTFTVSKKVDD